MHLRDETTYALGIFRNAVGDPRRNCAGGTEVQRSNAVPFSSAPELSLDGSPWEKINEGCGDPTTSS